MTRWPHLLFVALFAGCSAVRDSITEPSAPTDAPMMGPDPGEDPGILSMPAGTAQSTARGISKGLVVGSLVDARGVERAWAYQLFGPAPLGFKELRNAWGVEAARATGVANGLISGFAYQNGVKRAVYWNDKGEMRVIFLPPNAGESEATAVGGSVIVGWYMYNRRLKSFRFKPGATRATTLDVRWERAAYGVSDDGRFIVGGYQDPQGVPGPEVGYIWDVALGSYQDIPQPIRNPSGDYGTVGVAVNRSGSYAYNWRHVEPSGRFYVLVDVSHPIQGFDYGEYTRPFSLSNPYRSVATGITNSGWVVGWADLGSTSAFIKAPDSRTPKWLGEGRAYGVADDHCTVVGENGTHQAYAWKLC